MGFLDEMLTGAGHILKAPFVDISVLWIILPLIILWFVLEIYFDTHKKEKLGWNTALGNGISMFWITVELMRHLFENSFAAFAWPKFGAVSFIFAYALFISYVSFTHKLSAKLTYALAAPTPVYFFSGIAVMWAHGSLIISLPVLVDLMILFILIILVELILRKVLPESEKDEEETAATGTGFGSAFGKADDFSSPEFSPGIEESSSAEKEKGAFRL